MSLTATKKFQILHKNGSRYYKLKDSSFDTLSQEQKLYVAKVKIILAKFIPEFGDFFLYPILPLQETPGVEYVFFFE